MLGGFKSRWTTPRSWACWIASAISRMMRAALHRREASPCKAFGQTSPVDEGHAQVVFPVLLAEVVHRDDARMIETGRRAGLGLKPLDPNFRLDVVGKNQFDRDKAVQLDVARLPDDAHATPAQFLNQFIPAENLARIRFLERRDDRVGPVAGPGLRHVGVRVAAHRAARRDFDGARGTRTGSRGVWGCSVPAAGVFGSVPLTTFAGISCRLANSGGLWGTLTAFAGFALRDCERACAADSSDRRESADSIPRARESPAARAAGSIRNI